MNPVIKWISIFVNCIGFTTCMFIAILTESFVFSAVSGIALFTLILIVKEDKQ